MSEENKNPFTIGTPFTIQFDDTAASKLMKTKPKLVRQKKQLLRKKKSKKPHQ